MRHRESIEGKASLFQHKGWTDLPGLRLLPLEDHHGNWAWTPNYSKWADHGNWSFMLWSQLSCPHSVEALQFLLKFLSLSIFQWTNIGMSTKHSLSHSYNVSAATFLRLDFCFPFFPLKCVCLEVKWEDMSKITWMQRLSFRHRIFYFSPLGLFLCLSVEKWNCTYVKLKTM